MRDVPKMPSVKANNVYVELDLNGFLWKENAKVIIFNVSNVLHLFSNLHFSLFLNFKILINTNIFYLLFSLKTLTSVSNRILVLCLRARRSGV